MTEDVKPPEGAGWVAWGAANAPEAELWVNEERREISIIEGGSERRIVAPDATSFALEVADVERYYDASPKVSGARDAGAMLIPRPLAAEPSVAAGLAWLIGTLVFVASLVILAHGLGSGPRGNPFLPHADPRPDSRVVKAAWREWAEQSGSVQLRDAIEAEVPTEELYERDIARALTPELAGTVRCPDDVTYDATMDIEYDAARKIFVQARTSAEQRAAQFPAGTTVRVEPPVGCHVPGEWTGACVPVKLFGGGHFVFTCYRVTSEARQ